MDRGLLFVFTIKHGRRRGKLGSLHGKKGDMHKNFDLR